MTYHRLTYRVAGKPVTAMVIGDLELAFKKAELVRQRGFPCLVDVKPITSITPQAAKG